MKGRKDFFFEGSVPMEKIKLAEKKIGLRFANDYIEYVMQYGTISCNGHELTGISCDAYLDVVYVTENQWNKNIYVEHLLYVIEETHIDGIAIWQSSTGEIYQTAPNMKPVKICDSLVEYINLLELSRNVQSENTQNLK